MVDQVVIFGAGGHAKVVIDAIECGGRFQIAFLADADPSLSGSNLHGYPIRNESVGLAACRAGICCAFVAIGNNAVRARIAGAAVDAGFRLISVVHPAAIVARRARIGVGTLVMPGSVINDHAVVGDNVIINTGAIVEHDCKVADGAHLAPNVTLCGGCKVGAGTLIGAGTVVLPEVAVGAQAIVGAGSTVISDIADGSRAAGAPCRSLKVEK